MLDGFPIGNESKLSELTGSCSVPHSVTTVQQTFAFDPARIHTVLINALGRSGLSFSWAPVRCANLLLAPTNAFFYSASGSRITVGLKCSKMAGKVLCRLSGGSRGQPGLAAMLGM